MTRYEPGPRRRLILQMKKEGMKPRDIATALGVSTSAIYDHLRELRRRGLLEEAKSA